MHIDHFEELVPGIRDINLWEVDPSPISPPILDRSIESASSFVGAICVVQDNTSSSKRHSLDILIILDGETKENQDEYIPTIPSESPKYSMTPTNKETEFLDVIHALPSPTTSSRQSSLGEDVASLC